MMKSLIILNCILCLLFIGNISILFAQNVGPTSPININNIYLPFNNRGTIADVNIPPPAGNGSGGQFAGGGFLFSSGFYLSGYTDTTLWANGVATVQLVEDYQPGTVGMDPNDPKASLYKININDIPFGQSWQDWIDAVELGADFYDGDGDGVYNPVDLNSNGVWDPDEDKPDLITDETFWCVFNDGVPAGLRRWGSEPQGIEMRQTIFADASTGSLGNVVFIRYRVMNTGLYADTLQNIRFSIFADADVGDHTDDVVGCDTLRNGTYSYNNTPDGVFGNEVPAFMTDVLTGPYSYIPGITFIDNNGNNIFENGIDTPLDTAINYKGPLGIALYPGAKNLDMSASVIFIGGDPYLNEPSTISEAVNYMNGLDRVGGIADPCTFVYGEVRSGVPCNEVNPYFWFSGDPVTDVGWICTMNVDLRHLQTAGPFKLVKNEEVEVLVAYEIDRGLTPLGGITAMRNVSDDVQAYYEDNFGNPLVGVKDEVLSANNFSLSQNYPNPFNPTTKIKYQIPEISFVTIKVFDVLGSEVVTLVNEEKPAGSFEVEFDGDGLTSGIYFYQLRAGNFVETKKMVMMK